jgi:creatinine amidohydrolase
MSRSPRSWADLTAPEIAALVARDPVVVLPTAAIEQHGPHLPLSTDAVIGEGLVAEALGCLADEIPVAVLPTLSVGTSDEHGGVGGTLTLSAEAAIDVFVDVGRSVFDAGVRRLVIANSHGGNRAAIDVAALRLRVELGMLVVKAHWFRYPRPDGIDLPEGEWRHGLHGGAVETAMMLHLRPDAVRRSEIADFSSFGVELEGSLRHLGPEGVAAFAWEARDLNPHGVAGDARLATADLGRRLVEGYGRVLAEIVEDALAFPLERLAAADAGPATT